MPIFALNNDLVFPPVHLAEPDGLLAIGGDLSVDRLLLAYRQGIFPWYEGDHILWWCPDPRFILFPQDIYISKSMKAVFKKNKFSFSVNSAFDQVIKNCKTISRKDQKGTWITDEVKKAYTVLHNKGVAHSAEVWKDDKLVGGLYGIRLGKVFFGESMFSKETNASKFALIKYAELLKSEGVELIDCQVYTEHLESMGAKMISRKLFLDHIQKLIPQ